MVSNLIMHVTVEHVYTLYVHAHTTCLCYLNLQKFLHVQYLVLHVYMYMYVPTLPQELQLSVLLGTTCEHVQQLAQPVAVCSVHVHVAQSSPTEGEREGGGREGGREGGRGRREGGREGGREGARERRERKGGGEERKGRDVASHSTTLCAGYTLTQVSMSSRKVSLMIPV